MSSGEHGEGGHHERSWWQTAQGAVEDFVMPATHAIQPLHHAIEHAIPAFGTYAGLADAGLNIYQATQSEGSERWDHIGGAVLGALGAIPMVGTYTGAAELGWNGAALGVNSYEQGGLAAGNRAAHDRGEYANQALGSGLHSLWDGATGMASDAYNWLDSGVRGIYGNGVPAGM